jgi:hypothetical protein
MVSEGNRNVRLPIKKDGLAKGDFNEGRTDHWGLNTLKLKVDSGEI